MGDSLFIKLFIAISHFFLLLLNLALSEMHTNYKYNENASHKRTPSH